MFDYVKKERELLLQLNDKLGDLKVFLIGNTPKDCEDTCEERTVECLQEDMRHNLMGVDYAIKQLDIIIDAIKGGK